MLDSILSGTVGTSLQDIAICTGASLVLGVIIACVYMYRNTYTKNYVVTLALLPAMVQAVIMLVNGNLGTGVAVMGAFSLVRFRSVPGTAKEIASIFFAMAVGLAAGMGYVLYAGIFTAAIGVMMLLFASVRFGESPSSIKRMKITIPEDLDYTESFNDLFNTYTKKITLERVRTTNLGSLYELQYTFILKDQKKEKELLDNIRQRNGNLPILCGRLMPDREEL